VVEALLNGVPVIAHDIGALAEYRELKGVHLTQPPPIAGYDLRGTVLYPRVDAAHTADAAARIGTIVTRIEAEADRRGTDIRSCALEFCAEQEERLSALIEEWLRDT
jgi:hypothetical protein